MANGYVLVIRHPDYANEITVDGDVEVIDIDLGSGFDGTPDTPEQALDWAQNLEDWLGDVPVTSPVFTTTVEVVRATVGDVSAEAVAWVDRYVAARKDDFWKRP